MSASRESLAEAVAVGQLPAMPHAAGKVLRLVNEPDATAEGLRQIIETDPALTAAVLRLVNSALFGLPKAVSTVSHAVMLIGFIRLRALTLTTVMASMKGSIPEDVAPERDLIWDHSVSSGLAARALAERQGLAWSEEAFVAGLLHDCGALVMLANHPEAYRSLVEKHGRLPLPAEEEEVFGFTHEQVGTLLLSEWNLAPQLIAVAGGHHGEADLAGVHGALKALVVLSDRLLGENPELVTESCEVLGIDTGNLEDVRREILEEITRSRADLVCL